LGFAYANPWVVVGKVNKSKWFNKKMNRMKSVIFVFITVGAQKPKKNKT